MGLAGPYFEWVAALAAAGRFPGALRPAGAKAEGARIMRFRTNAMRRGLGCGRSFDKLRMRFDKLGTKADKLRMRFDKLRMKSDKFRMIILRKTPIDDSFFE